MMCIAAWALALSPQHEGAKPQLTSPGLGHRVVGRLSRGNSSALLVVVWIFHLRFMVFCMSVLEKQCSRDARTVALLTS